jgi:cell volume regulation protein A
VNVDAILIAAALLLFVSVLASKASDRFGVPSLLLFLILGMLAGSEGPGGIYFDDPALAQLVGTLALILILFSGGLDTDWQSIRPVLKEGLTLSTLGVLLTAVVVGLAVHLLLRFSFVEGLLLGAIVSSTDAAAVFSVLRSKGINLKGRLRPLLELESGSNDPMAIFLTVGLIGLLTHPGRTAFSLIGAFVLQMVVGGVMGIAIGRGSVLLINRLKLGYDGLYPALTLSAVLLAYGLASWLGGNGFLAVYLAGIVLAQHDFIHKRSLLRFHDGLAWLMQIAMFLTLGLLVFPSRLVAVAGVGLLVAACLMFLARPAGVLVSLALSKFSWREKSLVAWVGLRGAVPIILATYPLLAGTPHAEVMFNAVFFVVLTSVLLQGTTIPWVARRLHVDAPAIPRRTYPIEFTRMGSLKSELRELPIPTHSEMAGKAIVELGLPNEFLIILVARNDDFVTPSGGTVLLAGDTLLVLSDPASAEEVRQRYGLEGR